MSSSDPILQFRGFQAALSGPLNLRELVSGLPASLVGWLPDLKLDEVEVGVGFDPFKSAFTLLADARLEASDKPAGTLFLGTLPDPVTNETAIAAGLQLSSSVGLGGVPLFGSMLAGITLDDLAVSYASSDQIATSALPLPIVPAGQPDKFPLGFAFTMTLSASGAEQTFRVPQPAPAPTPPPAGPPGQAPPAPAPAPPPSDDGSLPMQWFSLQKQIGPLMLGRLGLLTDEDAMGLGLDASLNLTNLQIDLEGFTLAFKPRSQISFDNLEIGLDGLSVSFSSADLAISGGLLRAVVDSITQYNGHLLIQAGQYGISAVGSFAEINGSPSLFVFGLAEGPFGGPPSFYVTGIAAGFGYNRALTLPAPDQVSNFPLVLAATQGADYFPSGATAAAALGKLDEGGWVPPELGSYWVAAGVRFTSFELVHAFALLSVQFGHELVIALLGVAALQLPKPGGGSAFAYAEMALDAVLKPSEGTLQITALLTANSFVLDPDCRLTGGFAFYAWFGQSEHAGDFVITLGGYHPAFSPPPWYPSVPRLGFSWDMGGGIHIRGGAYFALTPSCAMGGGSLALTYSSGGLRAWFTAYADLIMWWKPFYFIADIGVSVGASYTADLGLFSVTFSIELGADLTLWGPSVAGKAHVHWWVISFTVDINGGGEPNPPGTHLKDWQAFANTYLPDPQPPSPPPAQAALVGDPLPASSETLRPQAAGGLVRTLQQADGTSLWLVSVSQFALAIETLIPATAIGIGSTSFAGLGPLGVYPLGSVSLDSPLTVAIVDDASGQPVDLTAWSWSQTAGSVPESMWGDQNTGTPPLAANVLPALMGCTGAARSPEPTGLPAVTLEALAYEDLDARPLTLPRTPPIDGASSAPVPPDARETVAATVATSKVAQRRNALVAVLNASGLGQGLVSDDMTVLAAAAPTTFQAAPMLGPLGTTGPQAAASTPPAALAARAAAPAPAPEARRVLPSAAPVLLAVGHHRRVASPGGGTGPAWRQAARAHVPDAFACRHRRALAAPFNPFNPATPATPAPPATPANAASGELGFQPGVTALWELPAAAPRPRLTAEGGAPVRWLAFDRQYRLLGHARLSEAATEVPAGAERLALTGLTSAHPPAVMGWSARCQLLLVAPQALLGEGVVVRPQGPVRAPRGRGSRPQGLLSGRALVEQNRTATPGGPARGWIETTFLHPVRTLLVVLRRDGGESAAPSAATLSLAEGAGRHVTLAPARVERAGETLRLYYAVPASPPVGEGLRALVAAEAGWRPEGVFGWAAPIEAVRGDVLAGGQEFDAAGAPRAAAPIGQARVRWT